MSNEYLSQTELGKLYGVSSHTVGKWIENIGLRNSGKPTAEAFRDGFVSQRPSRQPGTYFYVWHAKRTTELLDGMQYPRAVDDSGEQQHGSGDY